VVESSGEDVKIDWHGHSDRGLALTCALAAIRAGADRIHATALGIGERSGNVQMDLLLVNLKMMGVIANDISALHEYCTTVSEAVQAPMSFNYPIVGRDAFRTATGVHASAIIKAMRLGDTDIVDQVYSGVPARMVGRHQAIEVGPLSGESNVHYWLEFHGYAPEKELVRAILEHAKHSDRVLSDAEIEGILARGEHGGAAVGSRAKG
jgi:2-isopropylmalate synthase